MAGTFDISQGDTEKIVADSDPTGDYEVKVSGAQIAVELSAQDAERYGRIIEQNRPARLTKHKDDEAIHAHAQGGDATVTVSKTEFSLIREPMATLNDVLAGTVGIDGSAAKSVTDDGTGAANAAELSLGDHRQLVDIHADVSGSATLTVEVSVDGGSTWLGFDTVDYSSAGDYAEGYSVAFGDVRAYLNQNRNGVTVAAKGV
jgi:hypothetical protein